MHYLYSREKETTPNLKANNIILLAYEEKTKSSHTNRQGIRAYRNDKTSKTKCLSNESRKFDFDSTANL